jgi:hypothetical protein
VWESERTTQDVHRLIPASQKGFAESVAESRHNIVAVSESIMPINRAGRL